MTPAEVTAAHRAYLDAAGWSLEGGAWRDPAPDAGAAVVWYSDTPSGVARAAFVERARWAPIPPRGAGWWPGHDAEDDR